MHCCNVISVYTGRPAPPALGPIICPKTHLSIGKVIAPGLDMFFVGFLMSRYKTLL